MHSTELRDLVLEADEQDTRTCRRPLAVITAQGQVAVRCGSRFESLCPSCANLYRNDQKRVLGSGCSVNQRDGVTESALDAYHFFFVTLTAPSWGVVHRETRHCPCGRSHPAGSGWQGVAVDPQTYDYEGCVRWNRDSSALWTQSVHYLRAALGADLEYSAVREWQSRGALHLHALLRVSKAEAPDPADVLRVLQRLTTYTYQGIGWGSRGFDAQQIVASDQAKHAVRYSAKAMSYSLKDIAHDRPDPSSNKARSAHFRALDEAARRVPCVRASGHDERGCRARGHRSWGFGGHVASRSRGWSLVGLTLTKLRDERKAWAQANRRSDEMLWRVQVTEDRLRDLEVKRYQAHRPEPRAPGATSGACGATDAPGAARPSGRVSMLYRNSHHPPAPSASLSPQQPSSSAPQQHGPD